MAPVGAPRWGMNDAVPRKGDSSVHDALLRQSRGPARSSPRQRIAAWCTAVGITTVLVTVILSAVNAVSAQQAIAMALPAGVTAVGGLVGTLVPDAWTAWRRGFRQGCEAAQMCWPDDLESSFTKTRHGQGKRSG